MPGIFKASRRFEHEQTVPSSTWVIEHNAGGRAAVDVYLTVDGKFQQVIPLNIIHASDTVVNVVFSAPQVGKAVVIV